NATRIHKLSLSRRGPRTAPAFEEVVQKGLPLLGRARTRKRLRRFGSRCCPNHVELAIGGDAADARRFVSIFRRRVDANLAFWGGEADVMYRAADVGRSGRLRFAGGSGPDLYAHIGGFHRVGEQPLGAEPGAKTFDKRAILGGVDRLEIIPGGEIS